MRKIPKSSRTPSLSIRIDLDDTEGRIGPGKIQLLENIHSCGSISAAGRAMHMSYKRAWDLVDEINRICKRTAVERQVGGKDGGGAMLTPFGVSLIARYRKIEGSVGRAVGKELRALRAEIGILRNMASGLPIAASASAPAPYSGVIAAGSSSTPLRQSHHGPFLGRAGPPDRRHPTACYQLGRHPRQRASMRVRRGLERDELG